MHRSRVQAQPLPPNKINYTHLPAWSQSGLRHPQFTSRGGRGRLTWSSTGGSAELEGAWTRSRSDWAGGRGGWRDEREGGDWINKRRGHAHTCTHKKESPVRKCLKTPSHLKPNSTCVIIIALNKTRVNYKLASYPGSFERAWYTLTVHACIFTNIPGKLYSLSKFPLHRLRPRHWNA